MNKAEARAIIRQHKARLKDNINKSTSQFQVKLAYVNAHDELLDIAQSIINNIADEDDGKESKSQTEQLMRTFFHIKDEERLQKLLDKLQDNYSKWPEDDHK